MTVKYFKLHWFFLCINLFNQITIAKVYKETNFQGIHLLGARLNWRLVSTSCIVSLRETVLASWRCKKPCGWMKRIVRRLDVLSLIFTTIIILAKQEAKQELLNRLVSTLPLHLVIDSSTSSKFLLQFPLHLWLLWPHGIIIIIILFGERVMQKLGVLMNFCVFCWQHTIMLLGRLDWCLYSSHRIRTKGEICYIFC